jgi:hypothetical protein
LKIGYEFNYKNRKDHDLVMGFSPILKIESMNVAPKTQKIMNWVTGFCIPIGFEDFAVVCVDFSAPKVMNVVCGNLVCWVIFPSSESSSYNVL